MSTWGSAHVQDGNRENGPQRRNDVAHVPVRPERGGEGVETRASCSVCGHNWIRKNPDPPARCPKCRSTRWNEPDLVHNECLRCGHRWVSHGVPSSKCPKCQSLKWMEYPKEHRHECRRCGYIWKGVKADPAKCPKCKSSRWRIPPREFHCPKCGRTHIIKSNSRPGKCPRCDPRMTFHRCSVCGYSWKRARNHPADMCPSCGSDDWYDRGGVAPPDRKDMSKTRLLDVLQMRGTGNDAEDLARLFGLETYQARLYIMYMEGESPVRISMEFGISFEHTMAVIKSIGDSLKRI